MKKLNIAVIWYFDRAGKIWPTWRDGYRAAWEEMAKKHNVQWFLDKKLPDPGVKWDFICLWDDSNSEFFKYADLYNCRKGISLPTDPYNLNNLRKLDVIFCESRPICEYVRSHGLRAILAFGTDTDFYHPNKDMKKDIAYFYPATFSPWKRQDELSYLGEKLLCVGTIQPDGQEIYETCKRAGVKIEIGYFPAEKIRDYYWHTEKVIIPAVHGSERTVLEAMSMNIPVEVTNAHNARARSYLNEFEESKYETTRSFVLANYSHRIFAENLLRGIEQ